MIHREIAPRRERAISWLSFAAAPTFAVMGLLAAMSGGGATDMVCSATRDASPLTGMLPMYVLMSAFHSAPWLRLIGARARGGDPKPKLDGRPGSAIQNRN